VKANTFTLSVMAIAGNVFCVPPKRLDCVNSRYLATEKNFMNTMGTNKPELVEPTAKLEARSDPKAVAAWTREDLTSDLRPGLAKISVPFLEVMPYDPKGGSPYTQEQTVAFYKSILAGAKKATVVVVSPSAHFVMLDEPEMFYKTVKRFLDSVYP
jgi:pimeloyl-ACP methyl ester carboxylesterase